MCSVGRNIATLVVAMQSEVQPQQILEVLVLLAAFAQHGCEVVRPILLWIYLRR